MIRKLEKINTEDVDLSTHYVPEVPHFLNVFDKAMIEFIGVEKWAQAQNSRVSGQIYDLVECTFGMLLSAIKGDEEKVEVGLHMAFDILKGIRYCVATETISRVIEEGMNKVLPIPEGLENKDVKQNGNSVRN